MDSTSSRQDSEENQGKKKQRRNLILALSVLAVCAVLVVVIVPVVVVKNNNDDDSENISALSSSESSENIGTLDKNSSSSSSLAPTSSSTSTGTLTLSPMPTEMLSTSAPISTEPSTSLSGSPSSRPSNTPSLRPSEYPSLIPSKTLSSEPSLRPSLSPSITASLPSVGPTDFPSFAPSTVEPSSLPSSAPTLNPTLTPTTPLPTAFPTALESTHNPSSLPSSAPTLNPTLTPTTPPPTVFPTARETEPVRITQIVDSFEVIRTIPHETDAFTQGLTFDPENPSIVYESTGLRGLSDVRKVDIETGEVLAIRPTASLYFGEGLAYYTDNDNRAGRLIHITWTSQQGFIFDADSLEVVQEFRFSTARNEGWGITYSPQLDQFIVSDGSQYLHFWDRDLNEVRRVAVTAQYSPDSQPVPVRNLNELEWDDRVEGRPPRVLSNVWQEDRIVAIDPETGHVTTEHDLSELYTNRLPGSDVLNGIAISPDNELWITGKLWPNMYVVEFDE